MELTETQVETWLLSNPSKAGNIIAKINAQKGETVHTEDILFDIAKKLTSYLDVSQILDYVLRIAVDLIRAEKCSVFLMDQEKNELYPIAFDVGHDKKGKKAAALGKEKSFKLKLGQGIVGTVAENKTGQNIKNVYENENFNPEMDIKTGYKTKTMMCFPIMGSVEDGDDYLIGVSCLINKIDGNGNQVCFI
jgi:putative methionine-R-sulfoxide reductase with GAF domain